MLKILCLVITWKRQEHFYVQSFYLPQPPYHSVYNWTVNLNVIFNKSIQHKIPGQISVLSFYWSYIYFIDVLSIPRETSSFCVKFWLRFFKISYLWDLKWRFLPCHTIWSLCTSCENSIKPSPCTWGHMLECFSPVLLSPAGELTQSLGCHYSNRAVQVSCSGLHSILGYLCSWYFRVILHHCC